MAALAVLASLAALCFAAPQRITIRGVHDGDTFTAQRTDGSKFKIRLAAVDAPELNQAPYGDSARIFAKVLLTGSPVLIDSQSVDRYGRTLARVKVADTLDLSLALVKAGLAWWYVKYAPADSEIARAEREAKAARRGLWSTPAPVPPWQYRKEHRR